MILPRIVNTTLEMVEGGLMIRQSNGSPCKNMDNVRGSSSIRFICDTSVFAAGKANVPSALRVPMAYLLQVNLLSLTSFLRIRTKLANTSSNGRRM